MSESAAGSEVIWSWGPVGHGVLRCEGGRRERVAAAVGGRGEASWGQDNLPTAMKLARHFILYVYGAVVCISLLHIIRNIDRKATGLSVCKTCETNHLEIKFYVPFGVFLCYHFLSTLEFPGN